MSNATARTPAPSTGGWVSFEGLRWASAQMARTDLTDSAKLVLFALVAHVRGDTLEAWPSRRRIAALIGSSVASVGRALRLLEEAGLITAQSRTTEHGDADTNVYTLVGMLGGDNLIPPPPKGDQGGGIKSIPEQSTKILNQGTHRATPDLLGERDPGALLQAVWQEHRGGLPAWLVVTPAQAAKARARLYELPIAEWPKVVQALARSRWCVDKRLGPEFLLRPGTWPRALSGEVERWGQSTVRPGGGDGPVSGAQALKRRIDASGGDDHLAEAMRQGEVDGGL